MGKRVRIPYSWELSISVTLINGSTLQAQTVVEAADLGSIFDDDGLWIEGGLIAEDELPDRDQVRAVVLNLRRLT